MTHTVMPMSKQLSLSHSDGTNQ